MHASRSDLINPDSPFGVAVTLVSCCLLLYTAIIVQMEIGFVSLSLSLSMTLSLPLSLSLSLSL